MNLMKVNNMTLVMKITVYFVILCIKLLVELPENIAIMQLSPCNNCKTLRNIGSINMDQ